MLTRSNFLTTFVAASAIVLAGCGGGNASSPAPSASVPAPPPAGDVTLASVSTPLDGSTNLGTAQWAAGSTSTGGNGLSTGGVNCLTNESYHIHAHLTILRDGAALMIPAQIGLQGCAYELHTHDGSGIIHIETNTSKQFTLGQFFAVWGQPLSDTNVAGITGQPISVYLTDDKTLTKYTGQLSDIPLTAHRDVTIVIGTVAKQIASYAWGATL